MQVKTEVLGEQNMILKKENVVNFGSPLLSVSVWKPL